MLCPGHWPASGSTAPHSHEAWTPSMQASPRRTHSWREQVRPSTVTRALPRPHSRSLPVRPLWETVRPTSVTHALPKPEPAPRPPRPCQGMTHLTGRHDAFVRFLVQPLVGQTEELLRFAWGKNFVKKQFGHASIFPACFVHLMRFPPDANRGSFRSNSNRIA